MSLAIDDSQPAERSDFLVLRLQTFQRHGRRLRRQAGAKIIDFGVVKPMGQKLAERTLFTGLGSIVDSLELRSPQLAELNASHLDTLATSTCWA